MSEQNRFWQIYITLPPEEGASKWKQNKTLGVVAPSIGVAMRMVEAAYPGAIFWTIQHRGEVNHNIADYPDGWIHNEDNPFR